MKNEQIAIYSLIVIICGQFVKYEESTLAGAVGIFFLAITIRGLGQRFSRWAQGKQDKEDAKPL